MINNITSIGIENFRVFNKMTHIDLAPITILTGANNTGKSSFLKLMKLLKDNQINDSFHKLDLTIGENIKSINNTIHFFNQKSENQNFRIEILYNNYYLVQFKFDKIDEKKLFLANMQIKNKLTNEILFKFNCKYNIYNSEVSFKIPSKKFYKDIFLNKIESEFDFTFKNIGWDKRLIENRKHLTILSREKLKENKVIKENNLMNDKNLKNFIFDFEDYLLDKHFTSYNFSLDSFNSNDKFESVISQIKFEEGLKTPINDLDVDDLINKDFILTGIPISDDSNFSEEEIQEIHDSVVDFIIEQKKVDFNIGNFIKEENFKNKHQVILNKIKDINLLDIYDPNFEKYIIKGFFYKNLIKIITNSLIFKDMEFVNVERATQDRFFLFDGSTLLHKKLSLFVKNNFHNFEHMKFINSIFKKMEITNECYIEAFEFGATVKIRKGRHKVDLADCGFGVTQIFILAISMVLGEDKTLILEEPEANLHPKLQSKLAEIISAGQKEYNNSFIIETHSEYLIRKLQFLTAKKILKANDTVIHYFNSSDSDKKKELLRKITINEDGTLSQEFGKGFLDEADNIAMDLFKFQQSNRN